MKTKKKIHLIILGMIISTINVLGQNNSFDPFLDMVNKMYFLNRFSYHVSSSRKSLFDIDTIFGKAGVTVEKDYDSVLYLYIEDLQGPQRLLFINDSCWVINPGNLKMTFVGEGIEKIKGNGLSEYFPISIFTMDTLINRLDPFWKTIKQDSLFNLVSIDITDKPPEVNDFDVELKISSRDSLVYELIQDVTFKKMTQNHYQKLTFRDYALLPDSNLVVPSYLGNYEKEITVLDSKKTMSAEKQEQIAEQHYLKDPDLRDLAGHPYKLPDDGIIFLDFWYAGCFPCMKAAPVIEKLYREYKDSINFFGIDEIDRDTAKIQRFKNSMGISIPILINAQGKISTKIGSEGVYPFFVLINAENGKVLWKGEGYSEDLEMKLRIAFRQNL